MKTFFTFRSEWYSEIDWFLDFSILSIFVNSYDFLCFWVFLWCLGLFWFPTKFDPLSLWLNSITHHGQNSKKRDFQWFSFFSQIPRHRGRGSNFCGKIIQVLNIIKIPQNIGNHKNWQTLTKSKNQEISRFQYHSLIKSKKTSSKDMITHL